MQCVEHMVDFKISKGKDGNDDMDADYYKVNARDYFVPTQVMVFAVYPVNCSKIFPFDIMFQ